jgi:hypothetical protein
MLLNWTKYFIFNNGTLQHVSFQLQVGIFPYLYHYYSLFTTLPNRKCAWYPINGPHLCRSALRGPITLHISGCVALSRILRPLYFDNACLTASLYLSSDVPCVRSKGIIPDTHKAHRTWPFKPCDYPLNCECSLV